jgi:predicted metal-dependent peptidase
MSEENLFKEYDKIKSALALVFPFISSLLRKCRIVLTTSPLIPTAGVDVNDTIVVNKMFWDSLNIPDKTFVLAHEVMHLAFRDGQRLGERDRTLWNVVCDGINNGMLKRVLACKSLDGKMFDYGTLYSAILLSGKKVDYEEVEKMSKEEVYRILAPRMVKNNQINSSYHYCSDGSYQVGECDIVNVTVSPNGVKVTYKCKRCGKTFEDSFSTYNLQRGEATEGGAKFDVELQYPDLNAPEAGHDIVLQEGSGDIYDKTGDERNNALRKEIAKAYISQKSIGKVPLGLSRMVDDILSPKVNWRTRLRQSISYGYNKSITTTYYRMSRKVPILPGTISYNIPKILFLVDTSGSMSSEEIEQALGEVYECSKHTTVNVICWDAKAYNPVVAKRKQDVITKVKNSMKGGGGTVILPALEKCFKEMKRKDIVVIFTDGYIDDIEKKNTVEMLDRIRAKSSASIFLTTDKEHKIKGWETIKISAE